MSAVAPARLRPLLPTEANDAIVREAYRLYRERNDRTAISNAARKLGCPRRYVNRRGMALGLARVKESPWSQPEIELLERWAWCGDGVIAKKLQAAGFARTPTAVHLKLKRLKLKPGIDGYSLTKLCEAFGMDHHAIKRWIKAGWLKGGRRGTQRTEANGGDMWFFAHKDVRDFAMQHPDEIDLCKVEKFWFLDLITDGRICR